MNDFKLLTSQLKFIRSYCSMEEMEENIVKDIPNPSIGDLIIVDEKEFVYTDSWTLLGDYSKSYSEYETKKNTIPSVEHKCKNCGATLELDDQNGIFKCPYCKSKYSIRYI